MIRTTHNHWQQKLLNQMDKVPAFRYCANQIQRTFYMDHFWAKCPIPGGSRLPTALNTVVREYKTQDQSTECRTILEHKWQILGGEVNARITLFNLVYRMAIEDGASHDVAMCRAVYATSYATFTTQNLSDGSCADSFATVEWTDIVWIEDLS